MAAAAVLLWILIDVQVKADSREVFDAQPLHVVTALRFIETGLTIYCT